MSRAIARRFGALVFASGSVLVACGGGAPPDAKTPGTASPPSGPPPAVATVHVKQIECGDAHTCALLDNGEVRCWGRNKVGQLGVAGEDVVKPTKVEGIAGATQIGLAATFTCAILADKTVSCWGSGYISGDGKKAEKQGPTKVANGSKVEGMSVSGLMACARDEANKLACWGLAPTHKSMSPGITEPVADVAVAAAHGCALLTNGQVRCWADEAWLKNAAGFFVKPTVSPAKQLAVGDGFSCVLTKKDKIECWGRNEAGQLGVPPDFNAHAKPLEIKVPGTPVKISAGEASGCAVLENGDVYCWGANDSGVLGVGSAAPDIRPTKLPNLSNVTDVCIASTHGCARTKDGEMYCWGSNAGGQLGDGTHERRATPVQVKF